MRRPQKKPVFVQEHWHPEAPVSRRAQQVNLVKAISMPTFVCGYGLAEAGLWSSAVAWAAAAAGYVLVWQQ